MSVISFSRPHSTRPISLSLFSVISIDPFSLFARSPLLFCFFLISLIYSVTSVFFEFPCFSCVLCLSAFSLYSVFSPISLFSLTLPCVIKRFSLTTSRKTTTTCAENVLTLTPECFHHHVFLLPLHSSLISAFSLHSVTSAFYSPHFIVPFLCYLY